MTTRPAASANPKAAHYNAALTGALLRGAWAETSPAKAPNGTELGWAELLRKWNKHTGGSIALVNSLRDISLSYLSSNSHGPSASTYVQVPASNPSSPVTALANSDSSAGTATTASGSSFIHVPHPRTGGGSTSRAVSGSTIRGERAAYLSAGDLDGDSTDDPSEWAEGSGWWTGVSPEGVEEVREGLKAVGALISEGKLSATETQSAKLTLGYHQHALGEHEAALRTFGQVDWSNARSGVEEGDAAVLERIRGKCLQGMSSELSGSPSVDTYLATLPFIRQLSGFPFPTPSYLTATAPKLPFESHREVHRWISTSLSRAAVISSRSPNRILDTLRILRTYHAYAAGWGTSFRPIQRQRMLLLYLRALAVGYPPLGTAAADPYLVGEGSTTLSARAAWSKEVSSAMANGRFLLSNTTKFPRAGSINQPVTDFASLCVALADRHPALARDAIDVLWWAQTLTFQSQSVLRHLTRLLANIGDHADAKHTFLLYRQLVLKSRETAQPEISLQLKRRPTQDRAAAPAEIAAEVAKAAEEDGSDAEELAEQAAESEMDSDTHFVEALMVGARLLTREMGESEEAWSQVTLASEVIQEAEDRGAFIRKKLKASLEECKGIVRGAMASTGMYQNAGMLRIGANPTNRPGFQAQAINHLTIATSLMPNSLTAWYHLAFAQAEARNIESAIESIHSSLELDQSNVQSWHLLALLLTATRDWSGAAKACEAGISVWEDQEEQDTAEQDEIFSGQGNGADANVESKDFAAPTSTLSSPAAVTSSPLLTPNGTFRPLDPPIPPRLSRSKRLEQVIRLRMTLNIIIEKTQGPALAMVRQQELFAFFSARSGKNRGQFGYSRGLIAAGSNLSVAGLGGSYISVPEASRVEASTVNVVPPTPIENGTVVLNDPPIPAPRAALSVNTDAPTIIHSAATSPGDTTPDDDDDPRDPLDTTALKEKVKTRRKSLTMNRKAIAKHLHVPSSLSKSGGSSTRPSSVRRLTSPSDPNLSALRRDRVASTSSTALSFAPSAVHSHFRGQGPSKLPPPPPPATNDHGRTPSESRILSNLWLQSAATFRRWGKPEQCLVAIEEAETLDPENGEVWIQLGLFHMGGTPPNYPAASSALLKSILLRPDHPGGIVTLSKVYLLEGQVDLAHSFLNQLTQDSGWDIPEAWFYLAKACEKQGRDERARECLTFALGMEETRPARRWREGVDRWL